MNLTNQQPYTKPDKANKEPTAQQRALWDKIAALGCVLCYRAATLHHCGTGMGRKKNHDYVIPLCWEHHLGKNGIDGKHLSKRAWQVIYGSERDLWLLTHRLLKGSKEKRALS